MKSFLAVTCFAAACVDAASILRRQSTGNSTTAVLPPNQDPFYDIPSNISAYANGDVLRFRNISSFIPNLQAIQLFYKTTDNFNNSDGTATTVFYPPTPANPPRIVSYQTAEDSVNLNCAPSFAFVNGSGSNNTGEAAAEGPFLTSFAYQNGAYLVSSDFEGSKSAWLVNLIEARGVLDGIRAAINHYSLSNASVTMYGYSGGAHATTVAGTYAAEYAPELNIVGSAAGGVPIDPTAGALYLNAGSDAGLAVSGIVGYMNGYPVLNQSALAAATPNGTAAIDFLRTPGICLGQSLSLAGLSIASLFTPESYLFNDPFSSVSRNESLLMNVSMIPVPVPKFPRYIFHSEKDDIVPFAPDEAYVAEQCNASANIIFVRYPAGTHLATLGGGLFDALAFLSSAFKGTLPTGLACGANYTTFS